MGDKPKLTILNIKQVNGRLSSLARPRDLNLSSGSGAKPKKIFTPNLNAVRNKGKNVPTQASDGSRRSNNRRQTKEFRKDGKGESGRYIQSTGIFSEGTSTELKRQSMQADRAADSREGGGEASAGIEKPTIKTNAVWNIDKNEEAGIINSLLDSGSNLQDNDDNDYQPIVLPLHKNNENFFKNFAPLTESFKMKQDAEAVQTSVCDEDAEHLRRCSFATPKLFSDSNVALSLVRLPDSLPSRGFDQDDKVVDYTLDQMMEGQIGKIIKRRSGKMEVIIGNMSYSIDSLEGSPFAQDIMVVPDPQTQQSASETMKMSNIGSVNETFVIAPKWENLLSKSDNT